MTSVKVHETKDTTKSESQRFKERIQKRSIYTYYIYILKVQNPEITT